MDKVNMIKDWIMSRVSERTSCDGITIIAGSILILCGLPIIKLLAWPALAYGVYTLCKEEGVI